MENSEAPAAKADHLCVLVHGLWGNPSHLNYVASALRQKHSEDKLHILVAKRNSGSFTYDGIELGGERVTYEIEEKLEELAREGCEIKKLSVVGYSLGGLVARYAVGLLYSKGWFDKLEPVNFTTFATPHLGVRTPMLGFHNHLWNVVGARTLSMSGRQLFLIDSFRDTNRPILAVLADPDSIFIRALRLFKNKSLYANIVNDRSAVYYTTGISRIDPFHDLSAVKINYIPGYETVIVDPDNLISPPPNPEADELPTFYRRIAGRSSTLVKRLPIMLLLTLLIPVGTVVFLVNSRIQDIKSSRRIRLHEEGKAGVGIGSYRIPLMVEDVQSAVEGVFEGMNRSQDTEYLPAGTEESATRPETEPTSPRFDRSEFVSPTAASTNAPPRSPPPPTSSSTSVLPNPSPEKTSTSQRTLEFPTLALAPHQFAMIQTLDTVGFKKYPVHIHKHRHSHAAIIVRRKGESFSEGKVVVGHWLEHGFDM